MTNRYGDLYLLGFLWIYWFIILFFLIKAWRRGG